MSVNKKKKILLEHFGALDMKSKILIVEDELIEAMNFKQFLISFGYDVVGISSTGEDAIEKVAVLRPDLVLMDVVLKGEMDGIEAAAIIKDDFDIPVIYLTAHPEESTIKRAKLTAPYGYLVKPVNKTDLKNAIELALYKHQMESKLIASEKKYRELVDYSIVAIYETNLNGEILFVNNAMAKMFEYTSVDQLKNKNVKEIYNNPADREKFLANLKKDKVLSQYEVEGVTKSGRTINVLVNAHLSDDAISGMIMDITKRKKAEDKVKMNVKRFRAVAESAVDGIVTTDVDGKILFCNQSLENIFGYSHNGLIYKNLTILIPDRFKKDFLRSLERFKISGEHNHIGKTVKVKGVKIDGSEFPIELSLATWKCQEKTYFTSIIRDVTERKAAEEELKLNQLRLEMGMEIANLVYWEYDIKKDMFTFNDKFYSLYGTSAQEEGGYQMSSAEYAARFIPLEEQTIVKEESVKILETHDPDYSITINHSIIRRDGERRFIIVRIKIFLDENGQTIGTQGVNQDVTELIKAENALKESEEKYRTLFDFDPDYTILMGLDGVILDVNNAAEDLTGISKDEFVGKHFNQLKILPKEDLIKYGEIYSCLLKGKYIAPYESRVYDRKGEIHWVETMVTIIKKEEKPKYILIINNDITKRKKAENNIKKSLEEKEILLKEIHHRVKNNLQIISSLLDLQEDYVKKDLEAVNVLKESQNRVLSMAMIHEMIYQSNDIGHINFSDYIKNLTTNLFHSYKSKPNINSIINVEPVYLNIETSVPLGLIISELVSNSLKYAFPESEDGEISIKLHKQNRGYELIISDNGIGIPKTIDFKNNTTTLGLRLVNILVNQLDGSIELDRTEGTKYTIKFQELIYNKRI